MGQVAGSGLIASYGRDQERQSDDVGQRIAAEAGYDPAAISSFLDTLGRATKLETGRERQPSFFDSHPTTPERVQTTRTRAASLARGPANPIAGSRRAFLEKLRGLPLGVDPAEGVFQGQRFLHPDIGIAFDLPSGWKTVNTKSTVGAQDPNGNAVIKLQSQGRGTDVRRAADAFAQKAEVTLQQESQLKIMGKPAWRAHTQTQDSTVAQFTWFEHQGSIFRVDGLAKGNAWSNVSDTLDRSARSIRAISQRERDSIRATRLDLATARAGETLVQLGRRTGNAWSPEETAVANGVPLDVRFASGFVVKIAKEVPYRSR